MFPSLDGRDLLPEPLNPVLGLAVGTPPLVRALTRRDRTKAQHEWALRVACAGRSPARYFSRLPRSGNCSQLQLLVRQPFPFSGSQLSWEPFFFAKRRTLRADRGKAKLRPVCAGDVGARARRALCLGAAMAARAFIAGR